jgi:photosystem II stability/assembly factor-like uncharacterized protein
MNQLNNAPDHLYNLLPAIYRIRDEEQGGQLRALLTIIESELNLIEGDISDLYQNWFIETSADWVVPYIGDLLAVRDLNIASPRYGQERRAYVANTLAYRQRKGTTPVLEQLARDITGWGARVLEALPLLATSQNLNHVRSNGTVDLRVSKRPKKLGTPFENSRDGAAHTVELSRRTGDRGRYNPTTVDLYLWRLQDYPIEWGNARSIPAPQNIPCYCFAFNPLGAMTPLFNQPQTETELIQLAEEINLPAILTRATLKNLLTLPVKEQRQSAEYLHYFGAEPVFQIKLNGADPLQPQNIKIADLQWDQEGWQAPSGLPDCLEEGGSQVIVDPESGRFLVLAADPPDEVQVSYTYGFSGDIGGGPYERPQTVADTVALSDRLIWEVKSRPSSVPTALAQAVTDWNRMAQKWQNYHDVAYIPLGCLAIDENNESILLPATAELRPQLRAGILEGLQVTGIEGELEVTVLPGVAIDSLGRSINLNIRYSVILANYCDQTVSVAISYLPREGNPRWQITVVTSATDGEYLPNLYIRLAQVTLDHNGRIKKIRSVNREANKFIPGILRGLDISFSNNPDQIITVAVSPGAFLPGIAVNSQGQVISLNQPISASLNELLNQGSTPQLLQNRRVLLFLIPGEQLRLGAVIDAQVGIIRLQGNATVVGDLTIQIPATKQLHLVAANGDRPHLLGNIFLQGISKPTTLNAGSFWLDGLLLEGQLAVSSGNLQQLQISHSTLVPNAGGLVVEKPTYDVIDEDATDITLLAMLMYSVVLFQRLLKVGLGKNSLSPQQRIARITEITLKQMSNAINALQYTTQQWQTPANHDKILNQQQDLEEDCGQDPKTNFNADNGQLQITVAQSICGEIALADTVPSLKIINSIIDAGGDTNSFGAIAAAGTATDIQNSTILGTTIVRSLAASDSIFGDKVVTLRQQIGCMRFCYVPVSSRTPPRYRCQPDLLLAKNQQAPPPAITSLSRYEQGVPLFVGTAGQGIFYYSSSPATWIPIKSGLEQEIITALTIVPQTDPTTSFLLAGTASGMLLRAILPTLLPGIGSLKSRGTQVIGTATGFLTALTLGDTIIVGNQVRTVVGISNDVDLQIDRPFTPDITTNSSFQLNHTQWAVVQPQPFTNTAITTIIQHDRLGQKTIWVGTAGDGVFRSNDAQTWTGVNVGLTNLDVRAIEINSTSHDLFVGTYGNGVFWSSDNGNTWQGGDPLDPEIRQSGLTDPQVISLTINPSNSHVFAGTAGSGVFRSTDRGTHWESVSQGLKNLYIEVLIHHARSDLGTITTVNDQVVFSNPELILLLPNGNYTIVANEQTRILSLWQEGGQQLRILNDAFDPDLAGSTPFTLIDLFAGTSNGGIIHSTDEGQNWQELSNGLTNTNITALTFVSQDHKLLLYASTGIGSVFYWEDHQQWRTLNTGLDQVDKTLELLNQIQPDFTSLNYPQPGYAQLCDTCSTEIYTGAEDGSEMGVFSYLKHPQRAANLQASLKEYLRFGLQAKIIYIT